MRRRAFITVLGGAVAAWPLAARAQQTGKLPTIGYVGSAPRMGESQRDAALLQRLRELGWTEGRSLAIEYRWAENRLARYDEIAAEFVRLKVDVIVTFGTAVPALKQATSAIPIVFAIDADPVGRGLVASLARPGGNVTGLSLQSTDLCRQTPRTPSRGTAGCTPCGGHGKCRLSRRSAGGGRGAGGGAQARPRGHSIGNPSSGGYCSRLRCLQRPRGRVVCLW